MIKIINKARKDFDPTGMIYTETNKFAITILKAQTRELSEIYVIDGGSKIKDLITKNKEIISKLENK